MKSIGIKKINQISTYEYEFWYKPKKKTKISNIIDFLKTGKINYLLGYVKIKMTNMTGEQIKFI